MEYADDPMMHVGHETIYVSLFVHGLTAITTVPARQCVIHV
jgi:hypothetical protein